MTEQLTSVK